MRIGIYFALLLACAGTAVGAGTAAAAGAVYNLTGLPAYPNLYSAKMDSVSKTDSLGRWCSRFAGFSSDPLEVVQAWYRKALMNASETDLTKDEAYRNYIKLSGIKLVVGIDYVAIFKADNQSSTSIDLVKCSPPT